MSKTNDIFSVNIEEEKVNESIPIGIIAINTLIIIIMLLGTIYVFGINENFNLKIIFGFLIFIVAISYVLKVYGRNNKAEEVATEVSKLILFEETGEPIKEWLIQGETSLLIGKTSNEREADVDLSDREYASLISHEHAVLNYVSGIWYIEDLDSTNGIGIEKKGESTIHKLKHESPYRINSGDILYIANTRIMLK